MFTYEDFKDWARQKGIDITRDREVEGAYDFNLRIKKLKLDYLKETTLSQAYKSGDTKLQAVVMGIFNYIEVLTGTEK